MSNYQRARSPEQKAERMEAIMDATEALFEELSYHEINMGLIAKELGWARSNLYKYAATQEEVFLALYERACGAYIDDLVRTLGDRELSNEQFAQNFAKVTAAHPNFLRYQDILIAIIESNTSLERLVEFKRSFAQLTAPFTAVLQAQVGTDELATRELYLRLVYQAPGLYSHFHHTDRVAEAMRLAGMPPITGTFEEAYADFVLMCLNHAAS